MNAFDLHLDNWISLALIQVPGKSNHLKSHLSSQFTHSQTYPAQKKNARIKSLQIKSQTEIEHGLTSAPTQYVGYMADGFTGQNAQPTVSKCWRKCYKDKSSNENNKIHICTENNGHKKGYIQNKHNKSLSLHYNMGCLGDGSHKGHVRHAWTAVGLLPKYLQVKSRQSSFSSPPRYQCWYSYACQHGYQHSTAGSTRLL